MTIAQPDDRDPVLEAGTVPQPTANIRGRGEVGVRQRVRQRFIETRMTEQIDGAKREPLRRTHQLLAQHRVRRITTATSPL